MSSVQAKTKIQYLRNTRNNSRWSKHEQDLTLLEPKQGQFKLKCGNKKQIFPLSQNIREIYDTNTFEGKATIQLQRPEVMIYLHGGNSRAIFEFIEMLRKIQQGERIELGGEEEDLGLVVDEQENEITRW